jgi:hypothetical protein
MIVLGCVLASTIASFDVQPLLSQTTQPSATEPTTEPSAPQAPSIQFLNVEGGSPGQYASVSVQTIPNADCSIMYITPHGTISRAAGLVEKTSDANGNASWSWMIGTRTIAGTGTVTVTCGGISASTPIEIGQ